MVSRDRIDINNLPPEEKELDAIVSAPDSTFWPTSLIESPFECSCLGQILSRVTSDQQTSN